MESQEYAGVLSAAVARLLEIRHGQHSKLVFCQAIVNHREHSIGLGIGFPKGVELYIGGILGTFTISNLLSMPHIGSTPVRTPNNDVLPWAVALRHSEIEN